MYTSSKKAFTLVELIVVITILAILGTISFISLLGFQRSAREAARISDLNTIAKALDFFYTDNSYYPDSSNSFAITFSGSTAWNQGTFWEDTQKVARRISEVPTDPLTGNEYAYSITNTRQEYELWGISESILSENNSLFDSQQAHAMTNFYTNIKGNYNKQIVTVNQPGRIYILWVPTIITSEINSVTVQDVITNGSFAFNNSQNLPWSYEWRLPDDQTIEDSTTGFIAGPVSDTSIPVIYEWTIEALNIESERQRFADNLISYYQWSNLTESNLPWLDTLLDTNTSDQTSALVYTETLIRNDTWWLPSKEISLPPVSSSPNSSSSSSSSSSGGWGSIVCSDMTQQQLDELNNWVSMDISTWYATTWTSSLSVSDWCGLTSIYTPWKQYLTYVPAAIWQLVDLVSLDLRNNSLTTLPNEIGNLQNVTWLNLFKNQLTEIPAVVYTMQWVETLAINHNQILTVSPDIRNMWSLEYLYLTSMSSRSATPEAVEFPPIEITEIPNLRHLYAARNYYDTIPDFVATMSNLESFHIYDNDLTAHSPALCAFITWKWWEIPSTNTSYTFVWYRDAGQSTGVTNLCP